jgi:septum formation protein
MNPAASVPIVLGSRSPRRRELLAHLVSVDRIVILPPADPREPGFEGLRDDAEIRDQLLRIAQSKNENVRQRPECPEKALVLTADTIIVAGEPGSRIVLGQPPERPDWPETVRGWFHDFFVGRSHRAMTGVVLAENSPGRSREWTGIVETEVTMHSSSREMIEWYLRTGEPIGKAGGYALQGAGSVFISRVTGSLSNVVGLPLETVREMLIAAGAIAS